MSPRLIYALRCCTCPFFLETSTHCVQPPGSDLDSHQGAGHSNRETGQGTGDGPPQHENGPVGGRHATSSTAPSPQKQHQSTVQLPFSKFCQLQHCLI